MLLLSKGSVSAMKGFSSGFSSAYAPNGSIVRVLLLLRAPRLERQLLSQPLVSSVNCRQHTSAYVIARIRQHASAYAFLTASPLNDIISLIFAPLLLQAHRKLVTETWI